MKEKIKTIWEYTFNIGLFVLSIILCGGIGFGISLGLCQTVSPTAQPLIVAYIGMSSGFAGFALGLFLVDRWGKG